MFLSFSNKLTIIFCGLWEYILTFHKQLYNLLWLVGVGRNGRTWCNDVVCASFKFRGYCKTIELLALWFFYNFICLSLHSCYIVSNYNLGLVSCHAIQIDVSQHLCYFTCFFLWFFRSLVSQLLYLLVWLWRFLDMKRHHALIFGL